jgi:hypothetical protein
METDFEALLQRRIALLDAWVEKQDEIARLQAEAADLLAERWVLFEEELRAEPAHSLSIEKSMMAEYAAAGRVSPGTMVFAFTDARMLPLFPVVHAAFAEGRVTASHVREILRESQPVREAIDTGEVTPDTLGLYEQACLTVAERDTPARTRVHARRVAAALAGLTVSERQEKAFAERCVTVRSVGDGLALLQAVLPEHLAVAIRDRLARMARHLAGHPEDRGTPPSDPSDAQWAAWEAEWDAADRAEQVTLHAIARRIAAEAAEQAASGRDGSAQTAAGNAEKATSRQAAATNDGAGPDLDCTDADADADTGVDADADADADADGDADADAAVEVAWQELLARHVDAEGFWIDEDPESFDPPPDPDLSYWTDPHVDPDSPCIIHLPGEERTRDQLRADLLTDLLLTSDPSAAHGAGLEGIHPTIQVTIAATTLAGADDRPAELDGHGPIRADVARTLAGNSKGWTRLFLDPKGFLTRTDTYTPTEGMVRYLKARDQHCRFPGCRRPVHRCEHDHNQDWAQGGETSLDNLAYFCRTHHDLKHPAMPDTTRWTARQTSDRTVQWTSPAGRTYPDHEQPRVMFTPTDALRTSLRWPDIPLTAQQAGSPF